MNDDGGTSGDDGGASGNDAGDNSEGRRRPDRLYAAPDFASEVRRRAAAGDPDGEPDGGRFRAVMRRVDDPLDDRGPAPPE